MGMLVDGCWSQVDRTLQDGAYVRPTSSFAQVLDARTVRAIETEPGRFHLIASLSCPWSHRSTLTRAVKCLEHNIPVHIAGGPRTEGYRLGTQERPWKAPGTGVEIEHLHELYQLSDPTYTGRATVALLWDAEQRSIVSNESVHILRGLDAVKVSGSQDWTLRPNGLASVINETSDWIQRKTKRGERSRFRCWRQQAAHYPIKSRTLLPISKNPPGRRCFTKAHWEEPAFRDNKQQQTTNPFLRLHSYSGFPSEQQLILHYCVTISAQDKQNVRNCQGTSFGGTKELEEGSSLRIFC